MWQLFVLLLAAAGKAVEIVDQDAYGASALPSEEASPGQFPYQVGIWASQDGITSQLFCSGAILTKNTIITSAHCAQSGRFFNIVFGTNNISAPAVTTKKTSSKLIHEKYVKDRAHDIALLHFKDGLPYFLPNIQPVKLPLANKKRKVFGGLRLQRVVGVSSIQGDSGNPLVVYEDGSTPTLVGIASFGVAQSCETSRPAKFTRVTSYLKWIEEGIKQLEQNAS